MTRARDIAAFLVMAVLFGGAFPAIEVGLRVLPPLLFAALRYGVSGVLLLGYAVLAATDWVPRTRGDRLGVLAGGVFFVGGTGLTFVGQQQTTAGAAAVLFSSIPILTVAVGRVLLPAERLSRRGMVGLLVGLVGVAVVVGANPAGFREGLVGQGLVFLAALSVTVGTVVVRRSAPAMSTVALTGWAMLVGSGTQLMASLVLAEPAGTVRPTWDAVAAVLYLSVFASGIGFVVYFDLLARFGPLEVNLVSYLVPVVTVVVGWVVLDERVAVSTLVGFGIIAAGFALLKDRELAAELAKYRGAGR